MVDSLTRRASKRALDVVKEFRKRLRSARLRLLRIEGPKNGGRRTVAQVRHRPTWAVGMAALSRLNGRQRRELAEITAAESRLDAGVYGLCEICRRPIPLARLRESPTTRRCARCQANGGNRRAVRRQP